jgi:AcrR family transcriptional regulator
VQVDLDLSRAHMAERIAETALRRITRTGIRATTVDAVAREAGVGRATVYRHFPGGRSEVLLAAGEREVLRCLGIIDAELDSACSLDEVVAGAVFGALREIAASVPLQELLEREPEIVLPHLALDESAIVFGIAAMLARPHLAPHLDARRADLVIELVMRLTLSYSVVPAASVDLTDRAAVDEYVQRHVMPAVRALVALDDHRLPDPRSTDPWLTGTLPQPS